jgi:hypothetical protein
LQWPEELNEWAILDEEAENMANEP